MKGIIYSAAVGVLTGQLFTYKQWEFYAIVVGVVVLANLAGAAESHLRSA